MSLENTDSTAELGNATSLGSYLQWERQKKQLSLEEIADWVDRTNHLRPDLIVLTGAGLNLAVIASIGMTALVITVLCIGVAIAGSYYIGRWFGLGLVGGFGGLSACSFALVAGVPGAVFAEVDLG